MTWYGPVNPSHHKIFNDFTTYFCVKHLGNEKHMADQTAINLNVEFTVTNEFEMRLKRGFPITIFASSSMFDYTF